MDSDPHAPPLSTCTAPAGSWCWPATWGGDDWRPGRGDERLRRPGGGSLPPIRDLGPVPRKVELRERVQGGRGQCRQAHEVRFVLRREVALQAVRDLDESVVLP